MLASACSQAEGDKVAPASVAATADADPAAVDIPTIGTIGPLRYGFAPQRLTRAEVQLALPPRYERQVWATKFLPVERADMLGEDACRYDRSNRLTTCTAERENGLALALLERPIEDYRGSFAAGGIPESALTGDELAGLRGFCFTSRVEHAGMDHCFYGIGERTLLAARRYTDRGAPIDRAMRQVLQSLRLPS